METYAPEVTFDVPAAALVSIAADRFGLQCSPHSPLAFLASAHPPPVASPDLGDPRFGVALAALLAPEGSTVVRAADASGQSWWYALCQSHSALDGGVAAASQVDEATLRVELFASPRDAIGALAPRLFTAVSKPSSTLLPREWPIGAYLDTFHALDRFRRAYAEAALVGAPLGDVSVVPRDLVATLPLAAASDDLRWLLPAFLRLAPGVKAADLSTGAVQFGRLLSAGILRGPEPGSDESALRFGGTGRSLGLEFARGWWNAAGIEHTLMLSDGVHAMHRGFIAATALGNHWFTLREDAVGAPVIEHDCLSLDDAAARFVSRLTEGATLTRMAIRAECAHCGRTVTLGAERCGLCGHPRTT